MVCLQGVKADEGCLTTSFGYILRRLGLSIATLEALPPSLEADLDLLKVKFLA